MAFNTQQVAETTRPKGTNKYLTKFDEPLVLRFIDGPLFGWKDLAFEKQADGSNKKVVEDYWFETDPKTGEKIKEPKNLDRPEILDNLTKRKRKARYFWATIVWNVQDQCIQYFELDKNQVIDGIIAVAKAGYDLDQTDLRIDRTGKGTDTKYTVIAVPPNNQSTLPDNIEELKAEAKYDLLQVFKCGDPFKKDGDDNLAAKPADPSEMTPAMKEAGEALANLDPNDLEVDMPF